VLFYYFPHTLWGLLPEYFVLEKAQGDFRRNHHERQVFSERLRGVIFVGISGKQPHQQHPAFLSVAPVRKIQAGGGFMISGLI